MKHQAIPIARQIPRWLFRLLLLLFLVVSGNTGHACGNCVVAAVDRSLPGAFFLGVPLVMIWFATVANLVNRGAPQIRWVPTLPMTALAIVVLLLAGLIFFGPLIAIPPLIFCLVLWVSSCGADFSQKLGSKLVKRLRLTNAIFSGVLIGFGIYSGYIRYSRTEADFIMAWETTGPGTAALQKLLQSGSESLPDLRQLALNGNASLGSAAAKRLAVIGDPKTDVPVLIRALDRARREPSAGLSASDLEAALRSQSGINLPDDTTIDQWQLEWQKNPASFNLISVTNSR